MTLAEKNKAHYDVAYRSVDVLRLVETVEQLNQFLSDALRTDTSWYGLYLGGLEKHLASKRVLELGAGDGLNALVMAALGADVTAIDISDATPRLIGEAARHLTLKGRVDAACGDLLEMESLESNSFDFIVGKAFLHHLTHAMEADVLRRVAALLRRDGEARFFEPAVNSRCLDEVRWMVPVPGRPSSLHRRAFQLWRQADPHPDRDNSSAHYLAVAGELFSDVQIICVGAIERFHRLLPNGRCNRPFRRFALRLERTLPERFNYEFARSQLIVCRLPRS